MPKQTTWTAVLPAARALIAAIECASPNEIRAARKELHAFALDQANKASERTAARVLDIALGQILL